MKREQDWTDTLRSRLRDAETPPPPDGWQRLQRSLAAAATPAEPVATPARSLGVWRWRAAAVIVALCIGAGEWLRPTAVDAPEAILAELPDEAMPLPAAPAAEAFEATPVIAAFTPRRVQTPEAGHETLPIPECPEEEPEARHPEVETAPVPDETQPAAPSGTQQAAPRVARPAVSPAVTPGSAPTLRRAARPKTSLALFAGGGVSARIAGVDADRVFSNAPSQQGPATSWAYSNVGQFDDGRAELLQEQRNYRQADFRHHQPLGAGFTVRREFSHGLSLESGLIYTLLRSDVRMPHTSEELRQRLHFIGVPVRLDWQFVERNGFSLYMGAGGMIEKCVAARLGDRAIPEKELQWSLSALVGAQYHLGGPVGLYFEPDVSYYLSTTRSCTIRSESPLTVSLRVGLRLTF